MSKIEKPWGSEELFALNDQYVVKKLTMCIGQRCSLQYHEFKRETVIVFSGKLSLTLKDTEKGLVTHDLLPGDVITIDPGVVHRMSAPIEEAVYFEASSPELDDVIRLEDDYQRVK